MELCKREFLISRIRSGYVPVVINGKRFLVYYPDLDTILRANEIFMTAYDEALENDLFDDSDVMNLLIGLGTWSDQKEKELEEIVPGHIEYWKIELYNNMLKSNTQATIRKYLHVAKEEYAKLYTIRHSLDHMTCGGYASYVKNMYIVSRSARYKNKVVNWKTIDLNAVMNGYYTELLDSDTIRMLSHTYPWTSIWPVLKVNGKIFDTNNLTFEQQTLISWSTMYDRIYESPDCPSEEVINDDDMLDGWLLVQKRHREGERQKQELQQKVGGKLGKADDVFLMAETPQDAQKIDMLNEPHMARIKKQRMAEIKSQGGQLLEQQLSDVKMKRTMQLRQAFSQQIKGR